MSEALRIRSGPFGRVALLDMDRSLVRHAHPHCHVLLKVEGADTRFEVGDRIAHLTDEGAVLVNAWEPHAYVHQPGAPRTVILALYIEPAWLSAFRNNWHASGNAGFFRTSNGDTTAEIRVQAHQLAESMVHTPTALAEHEAMLAKLMISMIERFSEWRTVQPSSTRLAASGDIDFRIGKAMHLMQSRPGLTDRMEDIARASGMSRANFFRLFERETGITPRMYLNVVRLEQAVDAAVGTDAPFANMADDLGFSSPGHFTRFFAGHAGVPPSRFRQVSRLAGSELLD
jgi:AraC family transcriptional regulator